MKNEDLRVSFKEFEYSHIQKNNKAIESRSLDYNFREEETERRTLSSII